MKIRVTYGLIFLGLALWQGAMAQGHLRSNVSVNRNTVYVGQPVEVTVSVSTSTWFTSGVDPGNIKVNGAFTIYFRSINSSERINGKTYAGVNMIYHVFPYEEENIIFPSLEIQVETPDEGSSQGVKRTITTRSKEIVVRPVPASYDRDQWMVASNVSVSDRWSGDRNNVKVGDVLERTLVREVQGSVAELIPPVHFDTISGVSNYPVRAEVNNNKTRTFISASRTEGIKYLFEKEGEIVIPELVLTWWNPNVGKMQKRTLKEVLVDVQPNPDLGMLKSIRDSLSVVEASIDGEEGSEERTSILGLSLKEFGIAVILLILLLYVIYRLYGPLKEAVLARRENYRNSEKFYFRKYQRAARNGNATLARQSLYRWIDQLHLHEPTLAFFLEIYGGKELLTDIRKSITTDATGDFVLKVSEWSMARKNFLHGKVNKESELNPWINP